MDAFLRIGLKKSASLPVVAPAIGEALIATAIGLFAAIPAVIAYNAIAKRQDDLLSGLEASAEGWVALVGTDDQGPETNRLPTPSPIPGSSTPAPHTPSGHSVSEPPPYPGGK